MSHPFTINCALVQCIRQKYNTGVPRDLREQGSECCSVFTQGLRCPPTQQGQKDLPIRIAVADVQTAGNDYRSTACSQWAQHLDSATAAVYAEGRIAVHNTRDSESKLSREMKCSCRHCNVSSRVARNGAQQAYFQVLLPCSGHLRKCRGRLRHTSALVRALNMTCPPS